jgi:hypothetical protein
MTLEQQLQGIQNMWLIVRHQNTPDRRNSGCDLGSIRREGL